MLLHFSTSFGSSLLRLLLLLLPCSATVAAAAAAETYWAFLRRLSSANLPLSLLAFFSLASLKHAFCIPGGTALNALAGALFGAPLAIPLCLAAAITGTAACYALSRACGAPLLARWRLEPRIAPLRRRAEAASLRGALLRHTLSVRLVPLVPQWLVNLAAPHIGIPLPTFVLATAVGFVPYVVLTVLGGTALVGALEEGGAIDATRLVSPRALLLLGAASAALALGPRAARGCGGEEGGGSPSPARSPPRPGTPSTQREEEEP